MRRSEQILDLHDPKRLIAYLAGAAAYAVTQSSLTRVAEAQILFADLLGQGHDTVPFFAILDLTTLYREGTALRFAHLQDHAAPKHIATRQRYAQALCNRAFTCPGFESVTDALSRHDSHHPLAWLLHDLVLKLEPIAAPRIYCAAHQVRHLEPFHPSSKEDFQACFSEAPSDFFAPHAHAVAKACQDRLDFQDFHQRRIFVLQHFHRFPSAAERLQAQEIANIERTLGPPPPLAPVRRAEMPAALSQMLAAGSFPQGGREALSHRGSTESLVPSELAFFGEEVHPELPCLFTLRTLANEVLYFSRDENHLWRRQRHLGLCADAPYGLHILHPGQAFRPIHLIDALVTSILSAWFAQHSDDLLDAEVITAGVNAPARARWLSARFAPWIDRQRLHIHTETAFRLSPEHTGTLQIQVHCSPAPPPSAQQRQKLSHQGITLFYLWLQSEDQARCDAPPWVRTVDLDSPNLCDVFRESRDWLLGAITTS